MKKKIFALLALVMTAMTASASTGTTFTVKKAATVTEGTVTFQVGNTEAENEISASENDVVTIKVTPPTDKIVGEVTGLWYAGNGTAHAPRRADATVPITTTFTPEPVAGQENQWKFTMTNANAEISVKYAKMLTSQDINISVGPATYTGSPVQPTVTITDADGNKTLVKGTDFTVSYSNNRNAGTGRVTITGIGNYTGTVTKMFTINKAPSGVWFNPDEYTKMMGDPDFIITPHMAYGSGGMNYYSTNTSVATVDSNTGLVHIVGIGTTKIYATVNGDANYLSASDYYELTVIPRPTVTLNVPASGMGTYCGGWALNFTGVENPKAYTVIGCSYDSKTIWLSRVYDVPAYTPIVLMGDEGSYTLDCASSSNSYFKNMLIANNSGSTIQIDEQNDEGTMDNYYVKDGTFKKVNGYAYISNGKSYLQLPATPTATKPGSAKTVQISGSGKSTLCHDADLDFSGFDKEDLAAYVATGYDKGTKKFWFNRVLTASAGTPLYLIGQPNKSYDIPSAAAQTAFVNMLVGNLSGSIIEVKETAMVDGVQMRNLYLKDGTFMLVKSSAKISDGKCYMQTPLSTVVTSQAPAMDEPFGTFVATDELLQVRFSDDDDFTGIENVNVNDNVNDNENNDWYDLNGRKLSGKPAQKGVYVRNGRKVVIK